ncbi:MAG: outer membrane beta-barrel protein [Candidatus Omnitrophota bacterium]
MNVRIAVWSILISSLMSVLSVTDVFAQTFYREENIRRVLQGYQDLKGIRIGQAASLKATISQEGLYDDNIFLSAEDKKHDFISITSPQFLLDVPVGKDARHHLQVLYKADAAAYSNYKNQNYVNQGVVALADMSLPFGYLNVQNAFRDTVDRASTEFTNQVRRNENLSRIIFGVKKNKFTYETGYIHFISDYRDNDLEVLNHQEDIFTGTVYYQIFPKARALLEYNHGLINYSNDETRDGDYDQFRTGVKFDLTGKTDGIVKVGYQQREYDSAGRSGFNGFVTEAGINTVFSERTSLSLNYDSTAVESIDSTNNYYNMNLIEANLTQNLRGNFDLVLTSRFERRDYPEADPTANVKRRDTVLTEGITLKYKINKLGEINLGYRYTNDKSNIDSNEYKDNLISLRFDLLI